VPRTYTTGILGLTPVPPLHSWSSRVDFSTLVEKCFASLLTPPEVAPTWDVLTMTNAIAIGQLMYQGYHRHQQVT